jgi:hypothetical protein
MSQGVLVPNFLVKRQQVATLARSNKITITPTNGNTGYNFGSKATFNIETGANNFANGLNSGLKFTQYLSNAAAANFRWDSCGAHGAIDRIIIRQGGSEFDNHQSYGMATKAMFDLQQTYGSNYGKSNMLQGTRNDLVVSAVGTGYVAKQINSGELLMVNSTTSTLLERTYFLNLNCLLGSLSGDQYVPLYALYGANLTIEIWFVDSIVKAGCASATTITGDTTKATGTLGITNMEFILDNIELNSDAMEIVKKANAPNGRLEYNYTSWKYVPYAATISSAGQTVTIPINCKVRNLKSIIACQRQTGTTNAGAVNGAVNNASVFPYSSTRNGISQYQFRLGNRYLPAKPVDTTTEMFAEVCKVFGSVFDINYNPNIEKESYELNFNTPFGAVDANQYYNAYNSGSFYIGIDLEQFSSADKQSLDAGINTNGFDTVLNVTYGNWVTATASGSTQWDIFYFYNQKLIIENGVGYVEN